MAPTPDSTKSIEVTVLCRHCRQYITINVPVDGYLKWTAHQALIQNAMPTLSPGDRELLISHTCNACFHKLFPPEEEEDA